METSRHTPCQLSRLVAAFFLLDIGFVDRPKDEGAVVVILPYVSQKIQCKSTCKTYVEVDVLRSIPPSTQDDATSRQDHTLVCPQVVLLYLIEVVHEVLHEGDALPAWYAMLRWERIEPAYSIEVVLKVNAGTSELYVLGAWLTFRLDPALRFDHVPQGVQTLFENLRPSELGTLYKIELKRLHLVSNMSRRPQQETYLNFTLVDILVGEEAIANLIYRELSKLGNL
jgi:hypothetical protein